MLSALLETDPEFAERFADFAYDEVVNQDDLDDGTRMMAVLAALLGCQGAEAFRGNGTRCIEYGRYACAAEGNRLSGRGLSGNRPGTSLSVHR